MNRWDEELRIVKKEMGWTVRGLMFYAERWGNFKEKALHVQGRWEYAAKQEAMWRAKAKAAVECFAKEDIHVDHIINIY
jgi:hypothetical protein